MSNELVVLVDESGQDVGTMGKADAHRTGAPHRAISVFVFNTKGQLLVQRRAPKRDHSADLWSNTCCTHPKLGEAPGDAAVRRLREELGVDAEVSEIFRFWYKSRVPPNLTENEYNHVFLGVCHCVPTPNSDEVGDWAWWDVRYLRERIAASPESFTCWLRYSIEQVCDHAREQGLMSSKPSGTPDGRLDEKKSKSCFVICPFESASGELDHGDEFIAEIVRPVVKNLGYEIIRGHRTNYDIAIPNDIDRCLVDADLVVADLTDANPNVMYELGKRHAVGGQCVQFTGGSPEALPFDIRFQRTITYQFGDFDVLEDARRALRWEVSLAGAAQPAPLKVPPEKVARSMGHTVIARYGRADRTHYAIARQLAERRCKRIFMMQRSSTLILGPRKEWADEKDFHDALLAAVNRGAELFHLVDLPGLARHYRPSRYPDHQAAIDKLEVIDGEFVLPSEHRNHVLRRLEEDTEAGIGTPDRAARAFVAEFEDGSCEGVFVFDLGGMQFYFHIMGSKMAQFLNDGYELYRRSPVFRIEELETAFDPPAAESA